MAPRAYFIPFSEKEKALSSSPLSARYESDIVTCLSGKWDFRFYKDPSTLEDVFDTDALTFDSVSVPSVWQYTGYAEPIYMNDFYPFPRVPPFIPKDKELGVYRIAPDRLKKIDGSGEYNNIGVYRTFFDVRDLRKKYVISFLGVISSLDLFINGQYVGYSEGAHNTAEFLLDKYLIEGRNELVAMVRRWSNGTYLDGQTVSLKKADLSIPPQGSLLMPIDFPPDKDVFLNVRYTDKRTGEHVATEQILLHESLPALPSDDRHEMNVDLSDEEIAFTFDNGFSVFFDREKGALRKYVVQGKNLLNEVVVNRHGISSYTEIYRAPFDNDMRYKGAWHRLGFHTYEIGTVKSGIRDIPNGKEICFSYPPIGKRTIASVADRYCVFSDGTIKAETSFEPNRLKNLPRMGKVLELKKRVRQDGVLRERHAGKLSGHDGARARWDLSAKWELRR